MKPKNHNLRVALVWNGTIYQELTFTKDSASEVTIGEGDKNIFSVPAPGLPESLKMFERQDSGYKIRITDKIESSLHLDDEEFDLEELIDEGKAKKSESVSTEKGQASVYEVDLQFGDWGVLNLGSVNIFFQLVERGEAIVGTSPKEMFDGPLSLSLVFAAIAHLVFLITAFMQPIEPELTELEVMDRFARFAVDDVDVAIEEEEEVDVPSEDTTGKKAGGEEGEFGDPDEEMPDSKIPKVDGPMVDQIDVKNIGVHEALSNNIISDGPLANLFGNSEGFDSKMQVAFSGEGGELQIGRGQGGMGMRGSGSGGGGEGFGRVGGLGKVDTGGGKGTGAALGKKKERKVEARMSTGAPAVGDFCDPGNIRQVVNRRQPAIRHCFERELQTNPTLSGNISVTWRVQLDGSASNASIASSTMGNSAVESCIVRVVDRLRFEKPDGGICVINYPFVFSGIE
ncbi:hypothetical protein DL240_12275 [Lujinxingia litoralis]|uniref:TonB C-terminal domain-containing protein n=1 Tax=Lujinxingia litoralis TaxID=2211119 RepID=A0A328C5Z6_9DELT|nr:AgmX/PglI C-terminal domain-containing protein [Lujinxingia litoralis]RAL21627.1 hypothetical protein DL240_12275 [Lujinxingia litoralis]